MKTELTEDQLFRIEQFNFSWENYEVTFKSFDAMNNNGILYVLDKTKPNHSLITIIEDGKLVTKFIGTELSFDTEMIEDFIKLSKEIFNDELAYLYVNDKLVRPLLTYIKENFKCESKIEVSETQNDVYIEFTWVPKYDNCVVKMSLNLDLNSDKPKYWFNESVELNNKDLKKLRKLLKYAQEVLDEN